MIGPTGRNFAAGMWGGFAYVYDPRRRLRDVYAIWAVWYASRSRLASRVAADNPTRPRQRPVSVEDSGMGDPLRFDADRLRYFDRTASAVHRQRPEPARC